MVPPASRRIPRVLRYSGISSLASLFVYETFTLFDGAFQRSSTKLYSLYADPQPRKACSSVWALPLSLAATKRIDVSFFSSGYLDVSVPRVPFHTLLIGVWISEVYSDGFPHSEISGSKDICSSPKLIAAYHVFHRLLVPRHPPYALTCLTIT